MSDVCNLCRGERIAEWFKINCEPFYHSDKRQRDVYTIVKCEDCGLVFVSEDVTNAELDDIYAEGYYTGRDNRGYQQYGKLGGWRSLIRRVKQDPQRIGRFLRRPDLIRRFKKIVNGFLGKTKPNSESRSDLIAPHLESSSRLLDVGCATGIFLEEAQKRGWNVSGVELSQYASEHARTELGLEVFTGTLGENIENGSLKPESFDLVTLWDVVEHLSDPSSVLAEVSSVLKTGGVLFIETLNIDGDLAKEKGENWHFIRPPKHLTYYSESTLKGFLDKAGFDVIQDADFREDVVVLSAKKRA